MRRRLSDSRYLPKLVRFIPAVYNSEPLAEMTRGQVLRMNKKSPLLAQRAFSGGGYGLMFTRAGRGFLLLLNIFLNKLRQALNQPAAAANHVQPTFMLMFFQNIVQFAFKLRHGNLARWTHLHLAPEPV